MTSQRQILGLVDPSSRDHAALAQAAFLAHGLGGRLLVAAEPHAGASPGRTSTAPGSNAPVLVPAPPLLDPPPASIRLSDLGLSGKDLPRPTAPEALMRSADAAGVDLVVADTPCDCGPLPILSITPVRTLAEQLSVPLFVAEQEGDPSSFSRILVPLDFSPASVDALRHAGLLASLYGASVDVLHVLERPQYVALNATDLLAMPDARHPERAARRRIDAALDAIEAPGVSVQAHVAHGNAADRIVHFADDRNSDLIVLSSHGSIGQRRQPIGSVAKKVLHRVTCPVFLTRAFGHSLFDAPASADEDATSAAGDSLPPNPTPPSPTLPLSRRPDRGAPGRPRSGRAGPDSPGPDATPSPPSSSGAPSSESR
jgi:nucleotide-binding universal stress UspA family protein